MIWFNDISLLDVAPAKIVDILIGPIKMNPVARQRPINWGADFVRMTGGTRTVSIDFALLAQDRTERSDQLQQITQWARQIDVGTLRIDGRPNVHLMATCTGLPEPSLRQWWESKLRLTFTCFEPYWISDNTQTVAFSNGAANTFIVGNAPPLITIEWTNTATSDWAFSAGDKTMAFEDVPAGEIVIDLNAQTAKRGADSVMPYFTLSTTNTFIVPTYGAFSITCTTAAADVPTLHITPRWE